MEVHMNEIIGRMHDNRPTRLEQENRETSSRGYLELDDFSQQQQRQQGDSESGHLELDGQTQSNYLPSEQANHDHEVPSRQYLAQDVSQQEGGQQSRSNLENQEQNLHLQSNHRQPRQKDRDRDASSRDYLEMQDAPPQVDALQHNHPAREYLELVGLPNQQTSRSKLKQENLNRETPSEVYLELENAPQQLTSKQGEPHVTLGHGEYARRPLGQPLARKYAVAHLRIHLDEARDFGLACESTALIF